MTKKDTSGEKYLIFKEMGESIDMILGFSPKEKPEQPKIYLIDHSKRDGIAALDYMLADDGMKIKAHPQMKGDGKPSLWKRIQLMRQHMRNMPKINYPWKSGDFSKRGHASSMAYSLFDEEATSALLNYARSQKISLNALLLTELNHASVETMMTSVPDEAVWTIPLNMRGGASDGDAEANTTASISLRIPKGMDAPGVDAKIKDIYAQGVHWGAWLLSNITGVIGLSAFRYLAKRIKPTWVGVFSNLGNWPMKNNVEGDFDDGRIYFASPPATFILPVTTATVTWHGRMSLTLQLHPSISESQEETAEVMRAWVERLKIASGYEGDGIQEHLLDNQKMREEAIYVG